MQRRPALTSLLSFNTLDEAIRNAELVSRSQLCPASFRDKPADIVIAWQIGYELGISPMQALANIAVINGRATVWGDLIVAVVQASGLLEYLLPTWDEGTKTATVKIKRRGMPEHVETFSWKDAERAKLAPKDTYQGYPQRMCGWRAKSWAIRSEFADLLKGCAVREEMDYVVEVEAQPVTQPQRASETSALDKLLEGGGRGPAGGGAAAPSAENFTVGVLTGFGEKPGVTKGKKWLLHIFKLDDGLDYSTFDQKMRDGAQELLGQRVNVKFTVVTKGNATYRPIVSIEPVADGAIVQDDDDLPDPDA